MFVMFGIFIFCHGIDEIDFEWWYLLDASSSCRLEKYLFFPLKISHFGTNIYL